jgi:single stranded DNA-binding protein
MVLFMAGAPALVNFFLAFSALLSFTFRVMGLFNRFQIIGNLTRDPEYRVQAGTQRPVCYFDVAADGTRFDDATGREIPHTLFFNKLEVWGSGADFCNKYLSKGSRVQIDGSLAFNEYTERFVRPGEKAPRNRKDLVLRVEDVQLIKRPSTDDTKPEQVGP